VVHSRFLDNTPMRRRRSQCTKCYAITYCIFSSCRRTRREAALLRPVSLDFIIFNPLASRSLSPAYCNSLKSSPSPPFATLIHDFGHGFCAEGCGNCSNISLDFAKPTTRLLHISHLQYLPQGQAIQVTWRQTVFVGTSRTITRKARSADSAGSGYA
jgi:hypothetical protein